LGQERAVAKILPCPVRIVTAPWSRTAPAHAQPARFLAV